MAVTNDGFGNYFSGNSAFGLLQADVKADINSILTTLGLTYNVGATANVNDGVFTVRTATDSLTGALGTAPTTGLTISTTAVDQSRFSVQVGGSTTSTASIWATFYQFNSSNTNTEVTARGNSSAILPSTWNANVHSVGVGWAAVTSKSINTFFFKDINNYLFVGAGELDNVGIYPFPQNVYGMYVGKSAGVKKSSFSGLQINQSTPYTLRFEGALDTLSGSANYPHTPVSGLVAPAAALVGRRGDNDYGLGNIPNLIKVKSTETIAIGQYPIDLNNITTSDNNILSSTNDYFICVGRFDSTVAGDDLGDYILMRIKKI